MDTSWHIYRGVAHDTEASPHLMDALPEPPPWRQFGATSRDQWQGQVFQPDAALVSIVNLAILLRRPLLLTGRPGIGKSTLAASIAYELNLGPLLRWPITTRATLQDGLYSYDAIARLQDAQLYGRRPLSGRIRRSVRHDPVHDIGRYIKLGPLGTALLPRPQPRVLLIDEIDKSDRDFPNELLHVFEEGEFEIREVKRQYGQGERESIQVETADRQTDEDSLYPSWVSIEGTGVIRCDAFPIVIMTSNGERDFPAAFLRRCLRYEIQEPDDHHLLAIALAHFANWEPSSVVSERIGDVLGGGEDGGPVLERLIAQFVAQRRDAALATDQLLNLLYILTSDLALSELDIKGLIPLLWKSLEDGA